MKPILLIDDKDFSQEGYGRLFYECIPEELKNLVVLIQDDFRGIVEFAPNGDFLLRTCREDFVQVFIHKNLKKAPGLDVTDIAYIKKSFEKYVEFSGGGVSSIELLKIDRRMLFSGLEAALRLYRLTGFFPLEFLFGRSISPYKPLVDCLLEIKNRDGVKVLETEYFVLLHHLLGTQRPIAQVRAYFMGLSELDFEKKSEQYINKLLEAT